jgi:hypothetical protein
MSASSERPVEAIPDYRSAMNALSPEDRESLEHMQASLVQERADALDKGALAYETATRLEALRSLDQDTVEEYKRASRYLIDATVLTSLFKTDEPTAKTDPITYFRIADSLKKRATAPVAISHADQLVSVPDAEHNGQRVKQQEYLGDLAMQYWDRGVQALLHEDPESARLVASAVVEAAKDTEATQEYDIVLADTSEHEVAEQLAAENPEQLLEKIPSRKARLEVVSLSSQRINEERSPEEQYFSLAA